MAAKGLLQRQPCLITHLARVNIPGAPRVLGTSTCFAKAPLNSMDEVIQDMESQEFPARTVDYDADSDSVDEFPVDGFSEDDLQLVEEFVEDVTTSKGRPLEDDEDDTEGEPDLTSTSGDGPIVEFAGLPEWGKPALEVAKQVLSTPEMEDLELYSFRAAALRDRLYIRIDKMDDLYGSPTLDKVALFSRMFAEALEARLGEEVADKLSVEVSSPGAERIVRVPRELQRFGSLPMQVTFVKEPGSTETNTKVLSLIELNEEQGTSRWGLADAKANRRKGVMKLSKKEAAITFDLPISSLQLIKLHLEL
ncbi:hypothetical protein WJX75_007027 [Coccomyxa subellipsoidea]|uniref:DUF7912 domain-containing protein n=1 Tax=Coccomyxa subellipsoidea TaxID=248742 RepID=A0ABR2Z5U0_9CHLO